MSAERSREIRHLQKAKDKAQRSGNLEEEAAICNQLGEILARHGRYREALEEHRQELRLLESVDDLIGCAVAHRKIGERLAELENYEAALKHQRQHLELARQLSHHIEQQRAWATIGRTYMFVAESGQAGEALREAEQAFMNSLAILEEKLEGAVPQRELSEMRTRLYLNLGLVYDSMKDPAKCSHYIKKSIFISEQTRLYEDLYRAYFNLGNIQLRAGEHSRAMRCLERARDCAHTMKEKCLESECCASIAQVLLSLGDFAAARRALKKAYVLGSEQRDSVRRSLRYAVKASQLQEALEEAVPGDLEAALGLCEQLGDLFSKHGDYRRALEFYQRQLCYAESLQKPEQELAVIHVSLAATFGDLKEHGRAVQHYQAELALRRGNPLEEGKTWLNIALAREEAGEDYAELEPCFGSALQSAERAGEPRLQRQILRHLHAAQQRWGSPEAPATLARLQELCRAQGWSPASDSGEEEAEGPEHSEPAEESELELSESDGEENNLDGYSKSVPGRRRVSKWNRRNDRGETPLHRACIDGNLRQVQLFLEQGHPLNPRDYCGWTPLHEACNHGHLEIVRLLLDRGASVDDPGGPGCEGITPLHDALNCGHFDVAELLLRRGASAVLRNARGLSPLGTLQEWVRMYGKDLDQETRQRCRAMERLLTEAVAGRAPEAAEPPPHSQLFDAELSEPLTPPPSTLATPPRNGGPSKKPPPPCKRRSQGGGPGPEPCGVGRGWPECGAEPDDDMTPLRPVKKRQRLWDQGAPGEDGSRTPGFLEQEPELAPARDSWAEYRAAIRSVGSAQSRLGPEPAPSEAPARTALIPAEEYVGDSWLEDDLGASREPRKRSRRGRRESDSDSGDASGLESDNAAPRPAPAQRRRARQSRLTQIVDRTVLGQTRGGRAPGTQETAAGPGASELGGSGEAPQLPSLAAAPALPPPIRVRVRVQDNVFLIPVPHSGSASRPVAWLAEQAAQRYYQACGLLPRLSLQKEGALLAAQDLIVDVLQSNEEVFAEVQSWELPPLADRYRKACRSLAVGEHRLLLEIMELQESGPSFSACGLSLCRPHLAPLLRALKLQTSIRQLRLAGNGLADDLANELLATLGTMPNLALLDLSANQLGAEGLRALGAGLPGQTAFQSLEELDLSLNPLGDGSCQALAGLVQACPVLSTLRLQACGFTGAFLRHYRLLLASSLEGAVHLKTLVLSHNALGAAGLEQLLGSLPCATLGRLEIGSVAARQEEPLVDPVVRYLTQGGCALTHLTLSGNHLSDAAVMELARCLPLCPSLVSLDLAANPGITVVGLRMLLSALGERNQGLHYLSLAGCRVRGPLDSTTWARLSADVRDLRLCSRQIPRGFSVAASFTSSGHCTAAAGHGRG
ncbi:tonsoku-like protein isoform X2 [Emydura macquarii macquarii]|uniref:tonsoku-like protein isoform X2 n=1 Tax=Emydura macquarii macquarii TaxID=1129001 RepID=UPI00352B8F27